MRHTIDRGGRYPALRRLVKKMKLQNLAQSLTRYQPFPEYDNPRDPAWLLLQAILTAGSPPQGRSPPGAHPLLSICRRNKQPFGLSARFRELADATGCPLHDPLADLLAYPKEVRRGFRFTPDPHLTPAGHQALAQSLAPVVRHLVA